MNLIVAVDQNWAIGNNGQLLEHVKGDMINFKNITTGKIIVVGRETLGTFPGGQPLKNRKNIILTKSPQFQIEGGIIAHSIEETLKLCKAFDSKDIYIVGGSSVYEQFLPHVDTAYITKFHNVHEADRFFPSLDDDNEWELVESSETFSENDVNYSFNKYVKKD
jgi:dihydrofolate reductase